MHKLRDNSEISGELGSRFTPRSRYFYSMGKLLSSHGREPNVKQRDTCVGLRPMIYRLTPSPTLYLDGDQKGQPDRLLALSLFRSASISSFPWFALFTGPTSSKVYP